MSKKQKIVPCTYHPGQPGGRAPPQTPEFLTIKELAAHLSVSVRTVWRWVTAGEIKAFKIGGTLRFSKAEILYRSEKSTEEKKTKTRDPLMG